MLGVIINWCTLGLSAHLFYTFLSLYLILRNGNNRRLRREHRDRMTKVLDMEAIILALAAKVFCDSIERSVAIFIGIIPAKLLLIFVHCQKISNNGFNGEDAPEHPLLGWLLRGRLSLSEETSFALTAISRIVVSRLMRTYYANYVYPRHLTPFQTKILPNYPLINLFTVVDALSTLIIDGLRSNDDNFSSHEGIGLTAFAMPVTAFAFLMLQYSEWWETGGGRYIGRIPLFLLIIASLLLDGRDVQRAYSVVRTLGNPEGNQKAADSNMQTSLSEFLATSQLPPRLSINPLYDNILGN